jgi:hypothetical protein
MECKIITPNPIRKPQNAPTKTDPSSAPFTAPTIMQRPKITIEI